MQRQTTLKNSVEKIVVGLHFGVKVRLKLNPAEVDSGIFFGDESRT